MNFKIVGISDITSLSTQKIMCSTSDGDNIYVGTQSTKDSAKILKLTSESIWYDITDNLQSSSVSSVNCIEFFGKSLFAGTSQGTEELGGGRVYRNSGDGWVDTNLLDAESFSVRSLALANGTLYAAGSIYHIWKYKNSVWSKIISNLGVFLGHYHWLDLKSDGVNLFAYPLAINKQNFLYGLQKIFDNPLGSVTVQELDGGADFGYPSNSMVNKLLTFNNKVYACTYNEILGLQIYEFSNETPTQINQDGFGDRNNYSVADIKSTSTHIIVSTNNVNGSQIWTYNSSEGWVRQYVTEDIKYSSYIIQPFKNQIYLIGQEVNYINIKQSPTLIISKQQKLEKGILYWPDASLGALPTGLDTYKFFADNGAHTVITQGTLDDPLMDTSLSPVSPIMTLSSNVQTTALFPLQGLVQEFGDWPQRFNHSGAPTMDFSSQAFEGLQLSATWGATVTIGPYTRQPQDIRYPNYNMFNAIHASLIPKGRHRGKVMIMNGNPAGVLVGRDPGFDSNKWWSFQAWSIVDLSPSAQHKFLNYLLPISPIEQRTSSYGTESSAISNLFCAGHNWTPDGDLILAAGSWYGINKGTRAGGDATTDIYYTFGDVKTFVWNPATDYGGYVVSNIAKSYSVSALYTTGHYASGGFWHEGPQLDYKRWYPTVHISPPISRTNNKCHALVFGGDALDADFSASYNSYESYVISGVCSSGGPGIYKDVYNGSSTFGGPSVWNKSPGTIGVLYDDSFFFYPRTFTTSDGGIVFAGMTPRTSKLDSHNTNPGVWSRDFGYVDSQDTEAYNSFRYYGSAFRAPNVDGNSDKFIRVGGTTHTFNIDPRDFEFLPCLRLYTDRVFFELDTNSADYLDCSLSSATWSAFPPMEYRRSNFNSVLLPDATVLAFGGYDIQEEYLAFPGGWLSLTGVAPALYDKLIQLQTNCGQSAAPGLPSEMLEAEAEEIIETDFYQNDLLNPITSIHPTILADHAGHHSVIQEEFLEHVGHELGELWSLTDPPGEESSQGNIVNGLLWHTIPEIFDFIEGNNQWSGLTWDRGEHLSFRDYHSTTLLLPDGRIFLAGGEARQVGDYNPNTVGLGVCGYDFEIFEPRYLRPTENSLVRNPRPTNVGISGTSINTSPQHNAYVFSYSGEYILSSSYIRNDAYIDKVVLMPPGSVTHHSDYNQRYHECPVVKISDTQVRFTLPTSNKVLNPGFYMVFAVTNQRIPSEAIWAKLG